MKYKKKFNKLVTLILLFTITISIFTIPFIIQLGYYSAAVLFVFFLLFICFATGFKIASQEKDDSIEILIDKIKSSLSHNIRFSEYTNHLSEDNIDELNRKVRNTINNKVNNYFNIN
tara:strand:+ start:164 stop:514 length:351 start_codon:yes stop_codon:yes gene_type:complete